MTKRNFDKEPEITFQRLMCPFCNEPTGPDSQCYNMQGKPYVQKDRAVLPLYSESCFFRQNYGWRCIVNYVVSEPLIKQIGTIEGIDQIGATSKYSFQFGINPLFNQLEIKTAVAEKYKTFVKHLSASELDLTSPGEIKELTIIMPNGQKLSVKDTSDQIYLQRKVFDDISEKISRIQIKER